MVYGLLSTPFVLLPGDLFSHLFLFAIINFGPNLFLFDVSSKYFFFRFRFQTQNSVQLLGNFAIYNKSFYAISSNAKMNRVRRKEKRMNPVYA